MSIQRFASLFALVLWVIVAPASGQEASTTQDALVVTAVVTSASTPVSEVTEPAETSALIEDTLTATTEPETAPDLSVMEMLGLIVPMIAEPPSIWRGGYCYHDCSDCWSRDDCKEPGSPFGFPCTQIPLC